MLLGTELRSSRLLIGGPPMERTVVFVDVVVVDDEDGEIFVFFLSESHIMECFAMMIPLETLDLVCTLTYLSGPTLI